MELNNYDLISVQRNMIVSSFYFLYHKFVMDTDFINWISNYFFFFLLIE